MTDPLRPPDTDEDWTWPANTLHTWAVPGDPEFRLHRAVDETAIRTAWDKHHAVAAVRRWFRDEGQPPSIRVDEEPWTYASDLAPARGCLLGIVGGLALWALLILLAVAAWKGMR
jgi:hypothetical protein